jgi:hypothetical protein
MRRLTQHCNTEERETMTVRIETSEDLEAIVTAQNTAIHGMGELVKRMDARIRVLTALIDNYHDILVQHGLAKPHGGDGPTN